MPSQNIWIRFGRRFNHELMELFGEPDAVRFTKINRLKWLGHGQRMDEQRVPKKVMRTINRMAEEELEDQSPMDGCSDSQLKNIRCKQSGDVSCG